MAAIAHDYQVTFRSVEDIARVALEWRHAGDIDHLPYFDIVDFVENALTRKFVHKGKLKIVFFDADCEGKSELAFVTYKPLALHIDQEIWLDAKLGDPIARFIVAHEIGHIILHDHNAKAFSHDAEGKRWQSMPEYSAEWQANTFAAYFLLPDHVGRSFNDANSIGRVCFVPQNLADDRFSNINRSKQKKCTGEACPTCNNFTLVRSGLNQKCETCGMVKDDAIF